MRKQWLVLIVVLLVSFSMWGCGSDRDTSTDTSSTSPDIVNAQSVGNCTACHNIGLHTQISGVAGQNPAPGIGDTITHDCEACHGGGQFHHGVGPIPYPNPTYERCGACHEQTAKVVASTHNYREQADPTMVSSRTWNGVCQRCHTAEGYQALKSVTGDDGTNNAEAALDAVIVRVDETALLGQVNALDPAGLHNVACAACHNPLTTSLNTADPSWVPNGSISPQFAMCTSCHFYKFNDGTVAAEGVTYSVTTDPGVDGIYFTADDVLSAGTNTGVVGHHPDDWYRVIASTHYDNPDSQRVVEGYVIRENSANPCFDCHGHELRTNTRRHAENIPTDPSRVETIHSTWAQSGHAGRILTVKEANATSVDAMMSVGPTEVEAVFPHYDWDDTNGTGPLGSARSSCQKCHTSTGYMNFANNNTGYDPLTNDFGHLEGWTANGWSPQNELLYCWACHSSAESGALRQSSQVTADYTYDFDGDGVEDPIVFPDAGNSNTCVVCHSGRGNNDPVSTSTRFAGHHAPAAADLYNDYSHVAYEYPGLSYANPVFFAHPSIDINGSGPCVACHMNPEPVSALQPDHSFAVVTKDVAGVITAINGEVCITCHDGEHGAPFVAATLLGTTQNIWNGTSAVPTVVDQAMVDAAAAALEEEAEGYKDAGVLLNDLLNQANGLTNYTGAVINNTNLEPNDVGAFQNAKFPSDEPGGFAHNRFYVKRAMFDAIDWVDNGVIDGTITDYTGLGTVPGYTEAMLWLGTTRP